ncbi:ABC transporter permease [Chelativorans sp. Marseille-P2723]|uniref:ABC transporter permease n=1 Tax=Chelativorans sp. Marseille-P2723 TaxID=2709133 RepID=UPI00156E1AE9|nr:ABC transporter permease [Chelativorans sp. Marseille-P2723]
MPAVLALQFRVLAALVLRETRATFGSSQIGYLWAIITPAASTVLLVIIFTAIGRHAPFGASLALFFATGILTLEFFNRLSRTLMTAFDANRALLSYPPIKETDVLFARAILVAFTYILIMGIFFSGLVALGLAGLPAHPLELMEAIGTTFLLGFGMGATNAVIFSMWESWRQVEKIATRPLFIVSAIFYVPSYLPPQVIDWLKWNPVLHTVEWMRNGYYANYDSRVLDKFYVLSVAVCLIFIGLQGERLTRRRRSGG